MHSLTHAITLLAAIATCTVAPVAVAADVPATTPQQLQNAAADAANWLHHHRSYDAQHFSPLDEINRDNVHRLQVAWTYALGGTDGGGIWPIAGLEATPLVEHGNMYMVDGWGVVTRLDVTAGRARFVWRMDPGTDKDWAGEIACCGIDNKGVALAADKVLSHTLDGRLIATFKDSGEVAWERQVADPAIGETITVAPLVVRDMVITGVSGGEFGIRGWLEASAIDTGERRWRRYTIPAPGEPGADTWRDGNDAWKTGGGATWITGSYDPDLDLLYWGVGNPAPDWDREYRPGDNLYSNSAIALDPATGDIRFHFQYTPTDPFDYDGVIELTLVDAEVKSTSRKLLLHADRNGFLYAIDRTDGSFVYATPYVGHVNWTRGINPQTGKPVDYDPEADIQHYAGRASGRDKAQSDLICPGAMGGKNWMPMAYNPTLSRLYIPAIESCGLIKTTPIEDGSKAIPREWFTAGGITQPQRFTGSVTAIDVTTGKIAARAETPWPVLGGALATAGNLVFVGMPDGDVVAFDAETLKELWRFPTGSGINAPVMTYAVNGQQYIALAVGFGGTMPKWWIDAVPGLENTNPSAMIFAFKLAPEITAQGAKP